MSITTINGVTTDNFADDTSTQYINSHINGGSNGTFSINTVTNTLTTTGVSDSLLYYPSIALNFYSAGYVEVDMNRAENGGVCILFNSVDRNYQCYINDASSATNPNTFLLMDGGSYNTLATGLISFVRNTVHTIRLEFNYSDITLYFDGLIIATVFSAARQTPGSFGMLGGNAGQHSQYLRFSMGNYAYIPLSATHHPTDGHAIYDYGTYMNSPATYQARLAAIAKIGVKLVMNYSICTDTTAHMIDYINQAYALGMKVIVSLQDNFIWLTPNIAANLPIMYAESGNQSTDAGFSSYVINQVKNLPGVWGYYTGDEVAFANKSALQTHIGVISGVDNTKPTLQIQSDYSSSVWRYTDWTASSSVIGDDVYPYPTPTNPSPSAVAYGIGKYCYTHNLFQAIALQCYSKDGINIPSLAMMKSWVQSVYTFMYPRLILWFSYQDLLTSPNSSTLLQNLTQAIAYDGSPVATGEFGKFMAHM